MISNIEAVSMRQWFRAMSTVQKTGHKSRERQRTGQS